LHALYKGQEATAPQDVRAIVTAEYGRPKAVPCGAGSMNRFVTRRPRLRHIVLVVTSAVCCAGLGLTGRAWAKDLGAFVFAWSAPEECPSQQQVEAEIARLVGGDLRLQDGSDLRADVRVSGGPPWSADLTTQHAGRIGRRSFESPSCQAAADAVALIIALSIDPDAAAGGAQAPTAAAPPPLQAPVSRDRRLQILASLYSQGRVGTLPGTDVGVGIGVGLAGSRWRSELRWTYGLRRDQVASLPSGASGRFNVTTGSLTGCVDAGRMKLAFGPCAVAEVGRVSATGYGATAGFSRDVPWFALGGGVFSSLVVSGQLRTSVEVDALASLYRPDYVFDEIPGVVFKAPLVGGRVLIDLSWQF
jgi:hypothetical protein